MADKLPSHAQVVVIGGGVVDSGVADYVKADAYEEFAGGAVRQSKEWLGVG